MLENLIHQWLLVFCNLDRDPLGDDDGDATTNDVEAGFLLACFNCQSGLKKCVEIDLIVEDISSETDSGVY